MRLNLRMLGLSARWKNTGSAHPHVLPHLAPVGEESRDQLALGGPRAPPCELRHSHEVGPDLLMGRLQVDLP